MLNEFLMLGKPASLGSEPIDLNVFIEELMPVLIGEISGTELEITTEFEIVPPVLADSGQLTQVVLNLMRNSTEAVGNSGVISIGLKSREGWIEISFADNGPGFLMTKGRF